MTGVLSNTGGVTAAGGVIILANNNTFTGGVHISGEVKIDNPGALNVNAPNEVEFGGNTGALVLNGNSITVSGLSSIYQLFSDPAVFNGSDTPVTLTVKNATDKTYGGFIDDAGSGSLSLVKAGLGTMTFNGIWAYSGSTTVNAGTLRLSVALRLDNRPVAPVTIAAGATLELAGTTSNLSSSATRVSVLNNSVVPGILVSGTNQQVANIDGSGTTQVNAGSDLTADHIIQSALVIGGTAGSRGLVTIDASDASGNPLGQTNGFVLAGSLSPSGSFGADGITSTNLSSGGLADLAALSLGNSPGGSNPSPVPEPSTLLLALLAILGSVGAQFARHRFRHPRV